MSGALSSTSLLGEKPRGYWLPECGYAPALEAMLQQSGAQYLVVDPASLNSATIPHLRPRWMPSRRLTVLVRDVGAGAQVIAPDVGYTGDPLYRSTQRDQRSDLALWRNDQDGSDGGLYDPYHAFRRAHEHALHFSSYLAAELSAFNTRHDRPGLAVVPLDIDTLGRGWFEGPAWLRGLLEALNERAPATLTTPSAYLQTFRPRQAATLHDGSWGAGGDHRAWSGRATVPLYQALDEVEERLALLIQRELHAVGDRERLLNQAVRELLLAQSSDWPLQLSIAESDTAARAVRDQALRRPTEHLRRCERLCDLAELPALSDQDSSYLDLVEELDNPFPQLNYRVFVA